MLLLKEMNNKIIIFFVALLFVTICKVKSQISIDVGAGYSYNHLNTDISNREFTKTTNESGYSTSLQLNYSLNKILSLQTGVDLLQKSYSFTRTGAYTGVYETFTNTYIQIPFVAKLKIFEMTRFQIHFNAGVYGAYWTFAMVNGVLPNIFNSSNSVGKDGQIIQYLSLTNYSEKYQFNSTKDNRIELGLTTGISICYELNSKYSAFIEPSYYQSLNDQQKKYMVNQVPKINQTLCISIGFSIKLPASKK